MQRLCHLYGSMLIEDRVVPTTEDQGATNEPISKAITNDMALPISYRLGSKVPIQETEWAVAAEVRNCIRAFSHRKGCKVIELNVQIAKVHLLVMVPPKVSISDYVGMLKGRSAIRVFISSGG